jgi:hypothetical protein
MMGMMFFSVFLLVVIVATQISGIEQFIRDSGGGHILALARSRVGQHLSGALQRFPNSSTSAIYVDSSAALKRELLFIQSDLDRFRRALADIDLRQSGSSFRATKVAIDGKFEAYSPQNTSSAALLEDFQRHTAELTYPLDSIAWVPLRDGSSLPRILSVAECTAWLLQHLSALTVLDASQLHASLPAARALKQSLTSILLPAFQASARARSKLYLHELGLPTSFSIFRNPVVILLLLVLPTACTACLLRGAVARAALPLLVMSAAPSDLLVSSLRAVTKRQESLSVISSLAGVLLQGGMHGFSDATNTDESALSAASLRDASERVGGPDDAAVSERSSSRLSAHDTQAGQKQRSSAFWRTIWLPLLATAMIAGLPFCLSMVGGTLAFPTRANVPLHVHMSRAARVCAVEADTQEFLLRAVQLASGSNSDMDGPRETQQRALQYLSTLLNGEEAKSAPVPGKADIPPLQSASQERRLVGDDACISAGRWQENCTQAADGVLHNGGVQQGLLRLFAVGNALASSAAGTSIAKQRRLTDDLVQLDKYLLRDAFSALVDLQLEAVDEEVSSLHSEHITFAVVGFIAGSVILAAQLFFFKNMEEYVVASRGLLLLLPWSKLRRSDEQICNNALLHHVQHSSA